MKTKPKEPGRQGEADQPPPSRIPTSTLVVAVLGLFLAPILAHAQGAEIPADLHGAHFWLWPSLIALPLLILANATFVAAETALDVLRGSHLRALEKDDTNARRIEAFLDDRANAIAGVTLCRQTVVWWLVIISIIPAIGITQAFNLGNDMSKVFLIWLAVGIPIAFLNMVFGELLPKTYASKHPVNTLTRLFKPVHFFSKLFYWPGTAMTSIASIFTQRFGSRASFVVQNLAEEEIKSIAETAEQSGEIEKEERELLHSVFEFTDTVAKEIMTPRVDIDAIELDSSVESVIEAIKASGRSRLPIYEHTDDQIIGFIHAKDLLGMPVDAPMNLRTILRPVAFVPETKNLHDLLRELQATRSQMAIVQDEHGGTSGLVTIEDIVEELFGDIQDEYDRETPDIVKNGSGWIVNGRLNLYDFNSEVGASLESEEFDTVGGYVFGLFGRMPIQGDAVESEGLNFRVDDTNGRRIVRLHVEALISK